MYLTNTIRTPGSDPIQAEPLQTPSQEDFDNTAASSVGWIAVDKWGTRIASLITIIVLGRLLTPADFGLVALASIFITFAGIFVDQGFGKALVQRQDLRPEHIDAAFCTGVLVAIVLTVGIFFAAPLIAASVAAPELAAVLRWMALALLVNSLSGTPSALLERSFQFKALAIRRVLSTIAGGVAGISFAVAGYGVWSLVAQVLVGSLVGLLALWSATEWRPRGLPRLAALRDLWPVGVGVLGIELLGFFGMQTDRMLVAGFLGAQALGWYFMASKIVGIMVEIFASIFSAVSLPMFSRLQDDHVRLRGWLYRLTGASSAVTLPFFALAAALAPILLPFTLGSQWGPSVPIFQILALLGAINALAYFDRSVLLAVGKAKDALLLTLGQSVLGVILILAAAPYGVLAVAAAVVVRQYLYWPVRILVLRRAVGIQPRSYLAQWLRPFFAALLMSMIVSGLLWYWPAMLSATLPHIVGVALFSIALYLALLRLVHPRIFADAHSTLMHLRARKP